MPTTRRDFLRTTAALAGVSALPSLGAPEWMTRAFGATARIPRIGVQLYTVRSLMAKDFEGTLKAVAGIGYKEVEFAGYFDQKPVEIRKLLDHLGLRAPSAHVAIESLEQEPNAVFDAARAIGHEYVVVAWLDEDRRNTVAALQKTADGFNAIGEKARAAGLKFAYHNHNPEFTPIEGQLPYDIFLDRTDPKLVQFEMDLYWITLGGGDPLKYFAKYPGRFPMVHVKDLSADRKMVDVGQGTIDWKGIFGHAKLAGIVHYFVEHDDPPSPLADIKVSYEYLRGLRL
jgi:sugar phosphate isomerase/epimerase